MNSMSSFGEVIVTDTRSLTELARGTVTSAEVAVGVDTTTYLNLLTDTGYRLRLYLSPPERGRLAKILTGETGRGGQGPPARNP